MVSPSRGTASDDAQIQHVPSRRRKRGERVRPRAGRRRLPHWAGRSMLAHRPRCNPGQRARPLVARDICVLGSIRLPCTWLPTQPIGRTSNGWILKGLWVAGEAAGPPSQRTQGRRSARHRLALGQVIASAGIYRDGLAAGFTDGDAASTGGRARRPLPLPIPRPSPEPLMQAGPPVSTASPVTACALASASAPALDHGSTSCAPVNVPCRATRLSLSTATVAAPRGRASTLPGRVGAGAPRQE